MQGSRKCLICRSYLDIKAGEKKMEPCFCRPARNHSATWPHRRLVTDRRRFRQWPNRIFRSPGCRTARTAVSAGSLPSIGKRHHRPNTVIVVGGHRDRREHHRLAMQVIVSHGFDLGSDGVQQQVEFGFTHFFTLRVGAQSDAKTLSAGCVDRSNCMDRKARAAMVTRWLSLCSRFA